MGPWLGYSRVSRVGDRADTLISPELQQTRIKQFADARGFDLELLEPELDISGGTVERPILGDAIERIERRESPGLIVAQLDRLSRMDIMDSLATIRRIESAGGQVIAVAENFDSTTPEGNLARNMFLSVGQMQLDRYKLQFRTVKRRAVMEGIWPGSSVPLGYVKDRKTRGLVIDPEAAPRVKTAFEARASGSSWQEVAQILGRGASGANRTIRNRVYLGEIRLTVEGEEIVNPTAHEPIVSPKLFEAAQVQHPRPPRGKHGTALLAGVLRCAGCRRTMSPDRRGGKLHYRCLAQRTAKGRCQSPAFISANVIEPFVETNVLAHLRGIYFQEFEGSTDELDKATAALEDAEAELVAFQGAVRASEMGVDAFATGLKSRAAAVEIARAEYSRAAGAAEPTETRELLDLWPELSVKDKRHLLRGALGVVWVAPGRVPPAKRVAMIAAGFEPLDLPRSGRSDGFELRPVDLEDDLPGRIGVVSTD
jgi:site-specific DNA recombinase